MNTIADEAFSVTVFDGAGRAFTTTSNHPGSTGGYKLVNVIFDKMGRPFLQSNATEVNPYWLPAGDDAYNSSTGEGGVHYSLIDFDWKGRITQTTHPDGTYTTASYAGCGCAGGEVVTLRDERNRQEKVYSDVLGRAWKTEVFTWPDGSGNRSVYSTNVSVYNARDQVKVVNQYAGAAPSEASSTNENASCPTGTCQKTSMGFDGFGRLQSKHEPEQSVGTATVWEYNNDDTLHKVTDARDASATYVYNNGRHLVNEIQYYAPSGVTSTPNVTFAYDAAGNRTSMTDGVGSQSYSYNQLSQLMSETRTFTGVGTFALGYDYNLAGDLKKITDATGMTINYGFDSSGRLSNVTGSDNLYAGVSNYAFNFQYRAWGGLKAMTDGTNHISSIAYTVKMQPSQFDISGSVAHQNYDYYYDGHVSFVHNTTDINFDRSYFYDHVGRLTENRTGGLARNDSGDMPYNETFGYDAFGNLIARESYSWNWQTGNVDSAIYLNNRRNSWGYDGDGRNTAIGTRNYSFDADGQMTLMTGQKWVINHYVPVNQAISYDGDGDRAKEVLGGVATYYLKSSVLDGVVEELDSAAQKIVGYVRYPEGQLLARQSVGVVTWHQMTAAGTARYDTYTSSSSVWRTELDPMGADIPVTGPPTPDTNGQQGDIGANHIGGMLESRWSNFFDQSGGCSSLGYTAACHAPMSPDGYMTAQNAAFFGDKWYDLPGNWNEAAQAEAVYSAMVEKAFAPDPSQKPKKKPKLKKTKPPKHLTPEEQRKREEKIRRDKEKNGDNEDVGGGGGGGEYLGRSYPPIYCRPDVIKAMERAWSRTGNGTAGTEAGFVVNGTPGSYTIVDTKSGNTQGYQQMTITRNLPGVANPTFALFHVHPNNSGPWPSTPDNNKLGNNKGDTGVADDYGIPFYVISRSGLALYDPRTKNEANKGLTMVRNNLDWTKPCK